MKEIIIPALTAAFGFLLANWQNILGWKNKARREDLDLYNSLQNAVMEARKDLVAVYKILDEMEAANVVLKTENMEIRKERDTFKQMANEARGKLDEALAYVAALEEKMKQHFTPTKNNRDEKEVSN